MPVLHLRSHRCASCSLFASNDSAGRGSPLRWDLPYVPQCGLATPHCTPWLAPMETQASVRPPRMVLEWGEGRSQEEHQ